MCIAEKSEEDADVFTMRRVSTVLPCFDVQDGKIILRRIQGSDVFKILKAENQG